MMMVEDKARRAFPPPITMISIFGNSQYLNEIDSEKHS
jgi:hypothetical protein